MQSHIEKNNLLSNELADLEANRAGKLSPAAVSMKIEATRTSLWRKCLYQLEVIQAHPHILAVTVFLFIVLCTSGLVLVTVISRHEHDELRELARGLSAETGQWFSEQLDQAILPLFSMAQFVQELEIFHDLPNRIGPAHEPGSLPFKTPKTPDGPVTHRNVSGVCDDPDVVKRFTKIASTIKRQAKMDGVLVNLQLAPEAVVCLLHPMVNTEDFPPGIVMNNTGAWGHDLLTDPARSFIAEATIPSEDIVIAGPLSLKQCSDCDPTVRTAFIARIAIEMEGHEIVVKDVSYKKWGFAVALINWDALVNRSDVYQNFQSRGLEFQLTRTDRIVNSDMVTEKVVILAESPEFHLKNHSTVSTPLQTTNNEWVMTVAYSFDGTYYWAKILTILVSLIIALLLHTILVQNQNYISIKKRYLQDVEQPQKLRLRAFLEQEEKQMKRDVEEILNSTPIADLFPHTTVLFADIVGFTAWSSEREAAQVFILLQTLYYAFDKIARKRNVFKVETIGDCYVAVTGLPDPQPDHALRIVKFASECMSKMHALSKMMEVKLGPDTGDLGMRFGLHSGPVTAGILLGERSRFQLFGDTVNTASRMESTGAMNQIHLSQSTAELLVAGGKQSWLKMRKDSVEVKGKGQMQTYWLRSRRKDKHNQVPKLRPSLTSGKSDIEHNSVVSSNSALSSSAFSMSSASDLWANDKDSDGFMELSNVTSGVEKKDRLVGWHVSFMIRLLQKIVARHGKRKTSSINFADVVTRGETLIDEVTEVFTLPKFVASGTNVKAESVVIKPAIVSQLREFVTELSNLYHDNPFHNFEHASHVTMSVHKLLNRIATPEDVNYKQESATAIASDLHDYTFGITSDPLTHFAVVFSALVHDVDHYGVTNGQLAKEKPDLAAKYKNQSIAEQNSIDIAWNMLMDPRYKDLQQCLFVSDADLLRFRQIVVNIIVATDIFDKELKAIRDMRWDKAFHINRDETVPSKGDIPKEVLFSVQEQHPSALDSKAEDTNRKATIVLEHIMQASDVAHTMQHFEIYKKWNERLFQEMYLAYKKGKSVNDPKDGWYKEELCFFDNYVIPLAQKLEECGVFGVASDECLFNALENRREWASKGQEIVTEMALTCERLKSGAELDIVVEEAGHDSYSSDGME